MTVAKPTGEYAMEMLEPGGWVETDEQSLYDRAQQYTQILQQTTKALEGFQHERGEIFDGGVFEGTAANAAKGKIDEFIDDLIGLQQHLVSAVTWYQKAGDTVAKTKSGIADRVHATQREIGELKNNADSDSDELADEIESLVNRALSENGEDVTIAASSLPAAGTWKPPANALQNLLNQKAPPLATKPGAASVQQPGEPGPSTAVAGARPSQGTGQPGVAGVSLPPAARSGGLQPATLNSVHAGTPSTAPPAAAGGLGNSGSTPAAPSNPGGPGPAPPPPAVAGGLGNSGSTPAAPSNPGGPGPAPPPPAVAGGFGNSGSTAATPSSPSAYRPPAALTPQGPIASAHQAPGSGVNPNDIMGPVTGGLGGLGSGGSGGGGDGHGGSGVMGSMVNNAFGAQQGGQQNPFSAEAFEHHLERPDAGLQQAANQAAVNNAAGSAASSAASAATSAAVQVPLSAAAPMAPAAAHGPTAAELSAAAAPSGGGVVSGGGSAGGAVSASMSSAESSVSSMPLLPPATPHAAAPVSASGAGGAANTGSGGPGVHPASTTSVGRSGFGGSAASSQAEAAPAPIPVSSARAQKEAIAEATRRQGGGDVRVAYRLAAALNAPDMVNKGDFKFFWMTAVTADGQIAVANSYGLAFIPDAVKLPAQVKMVSADEAIPVDERARWATYPNLALQGWAAHHNTTLRTVIARREQFAGIDPGVPTQFVADEDIPASGKMQGRSRLEVVAPGEAARLAAAGDLDLVEMLPPAPVDASPPADQRSSLWFDLMKHLMSSDAERGVAHLQSFATYAAHARELALHRAHSAVHAVEQRDAVADWLYWQRIAELLHDALASPAR